ncbi:hypothetical protein ADIS_2238 [Lunatimonas lonarensis]|uniref:Uncharacterized protein n=1 Tax=Lunatimonas lonarensis TaxID=1232681 RepID=R7ZTB4_9BACT|nr:hypothetical protein ADIS_2238 [Lunatimonas lonarensis]
MSANCFRANLLSMSLKFNSCQLAKLPFFDKSPKLFLIGISTGLKMV